eukprot:6210829-Alexandrium_andersonii.AAC.1
MATPSGVRGWSDPCMELVRQDPALAGLTLEQAAKRTQGEHKFDLGCLPEPCGALAPCVVNVFSDGGVTFPSEPWRSVAGVGLWCPGGDSPPPSLPPDLWDFAMSEPKGEGVGFWTRLFGPRISSTRSEGMAVLLG